MKLAQALKTKNRLAGEIARWQQILQRENARRDDSVSTVDRSQVYQKIEALSVELGNLKAKIARANIGIYSNLERMAEYKAHIAFLTSLPKREGPEVELVGRDQERIEYTWNSFITQQICDSKVAEIEQQIALLQDTVDEYNATTEI